MEIGNLSQDPENISLAERKRLIQLALDTCAYPPQLTYPETTCDDSNLVSLFSWPVLRKLRVIEDVDFKYSVLYVKYTCTGGSTNGGSTTFSTLSLCFLERNPEVVVYLPFVLSKKNGFTKRLMEHVHEGILSTNGLSSAINHLERCRRNRYYELLSMFAYAVNRRHSENASYSPPTPPTVDAYLANNKVVSHGTLTVAWLTYTELYSSLCALVMK
ncbi:hypothetical protein JG688_00009535 [Phytophthora aleatoria]|uniref:Uncharacterized protein n=1 Tax=Phytophthora aleatoria TaxID=2496075 RepID=A0A8J5ITK9_9STRA|nr:hypothetical protein JG688_00009535 [Phytophthora aleatoria]